MIRPGTLLMIALLSCASVANGFVLPVERLTADPDVDYTDKLPVVAGDRVAWFRGWGVTLQDGADRTDLAYDQGHGYGWDLGLSDSIVAWISCSYYDAGCFGPALFVYDGVEIALIADSFVPGTPIPMSLDVDGDRVVWAAYDGEIRLTENGVTTLITDQAGAMAPAAKDPAIHGSRIVWHVGDQVFLYDGVETVPVFDDPNRTSGVGDLDVSDDGVAWSYYDGVDTRAYYFDGVEAVDVSQGNVYAPGVSLSGHRLVWAASDGADYEIYSWSGGAVDPLSDNDFNDLGPVAMGEATAWMANPGPSTHGEVFYNDGVSSQRVTFSDYLKFSLTGGPGGRIAWVGCPDAPEGPQHDTCYEDTGHVVFAVNWDVFVAPEPDAAPLGVFASISLAGVGRRRWSRGSITPPRRWGSR